jgi:hypothetical protein
MKIAAIIPTRGQSRKVFTAYQVERAKAMGYDKVYLIDYLPNGNAFDLFERMAQGIANAIADGIDFVSIIEDDDHYRLDYLDTIKPILEKVQIIGINRTTYYHLFSTGWKIMVHPGRSSMFCTSFRTDLFKAFPKHGAPYHDLSIWKFAQDYNVNFRLIDKDIAMGIKHGQVFGPVGGNGHTMKYPQTDLTLRYLKSRTDVEAFKFYKELKESYQADWK